MVVQAFDRRRQQAAERARGEQGLEGLEGVEGKRLRGVSVGGEEGGAENERHLVAMVGRRGLGGGGRGQGGHARGEPGDEDEGPDVQGDLPR